MEPGRAYSQGSTGLQLYPEPGAATIRQAERQIPTECGVLDLDTLSTAQRNLLGLGIRQTQIENIANDPWFFPVRDAGGGEGLTFRWGRWETVAGDTINGILTSEEYRQCISQAISFEPPEGMTISGDVCEEDAQGMLSPPDNSFIRIDPNVALDCIEPNSYTGLSLQPNDQQGQIIYYDGLPNAEGCTVDMRFVTRTVNSVFKPPQRQGQLISTTIGGSEVNFPTYTWLYVILYGRPINPLLFQRSSADFSEDFTQIGYPNGQEPDYGVINTQGGGQTGGGQGGQP